MCRKGGIASPVHRAGLVNRNVIPRRIDRYDPRPRQRRVPLIVGQGRPTIPDGDSREPAGSADAPDQLQRHRGSRKRRHLAFLDWRAGRKPVVELTETTLLMESVASNEVVRLLVEQ